MSLNKFLTNTSGGEEVDLAPIYAALDTKVQRTGDTMTGDLNMGAFRVTSTAPPAQPTDFVTLDYVNTNTITNPFTGTLQVDDWKRKTPFP
jgi:hypothetical protein